MHTSLSLPSRFHHPTNYCEKLSDYLSEYNNNNYMCMVWSRTKPIYKQTAPTFNGMGARGNVSKRQNISHPTKLSF